MERKSFARKAAAASFSAALVFGTAACGDDDDSGVTDEIGEDIEEGGDEVDEETSE